MIKSDDHIVSADIEKKLSKVFDEVAVLFSSGKTFDEIVDDSTFRATLVPE